MNDDAYKAAQLLDKQILIWAVVIVGALGLLMFRLITNQLVAILKQLQVTVDRLVLGFERHTVILETHDDDIKDLQQRKTTRK